MEQAGEWDGRDRESLQHNLKGWGGETAIVPRWLEKGDVYNQLPPQLLLF